MPILFLLIGVGLIVYLVNRYYAKNWSKKLNVDIQFQPLPAYEGGRAFMTETIRNEKRMPLPLLHVKFQTDRGCAFDKEENAVVSDQTYKNDIFSLAGYSQVKRTLAFTCLKRGMYKLDSVDLIASFMFFSDFSYDSQKQDTSIIVYPSLIDLEGLDELVSKMVLSISTKSLLMPDPFSFAGIREYQPYDPMKTINWKATAHTGDVMVNVPEYMAGQPVRLLLNLQKPLGRLAENIQEESIRIATTWADRLMREGLFVDLQSNYDTKKPKELGESWDELNTRMAMVDVNRSGRNFHEWMEKDIIPFAESNVCYGIISHDETPEMQAVVEALAEIVGELWLIRPGLTDCERYAHTGRVHVLERWVNAYGK